MNLKLFTHKCGVLQQNLCFICKDVKLDHMAIVVSVDNLRI